MRSPWKTQFVASLQAAIGTAGGTGESRIQGVEMESDGTPWRLLVTDPITLEVGGGSGAGGRHCFGLEGFRWLTLRDSIAAGPGRL